MTLAEDGVLALDSPITTYVPFAPPSWEAVTVRRLAMHTSGISDDLGPGAPADAEEAARRLAERPPQFEPGTRSSCTGAA